MAYDVGVKIGVEGEKTFQSAVRGVNAQLKNLSAEMKAAMASFDKADQSEAKLAAQNAVLAKSMDAAKSKIGILRTEYEKQQSVLAELATALENAKSQFGAQSEEAIKAQNAYNKQATAVNNLGTQLNNATADLRTMERQSADNERAMREMADAASNAGDGLSDTADAANEVADSLDDAGDRAATFGDVFRANILSDVIIEGVKTIARTIKDMAGDFVSAAAEIKAETSQFEQTFGDTGDQAEEAIGRVAGASGILDTRLNTVGTQIYAFARASGGTASESLALMETALQATADSAAYYDRSLEDTADSLQSFLKGNFENDAALGLSATETTRNTAAMELFGKKFNDLSEIQKQQTLLKMVVDAQKLSGAMGQASREADGWENVQGNLNEAWRQFMAAAGEPFLENITPVVQEVTQALQDLTDGIDWDAFSRTVSDAFGTALSVARDVAEWILTNWSSIAAAIAGIAAAIATIRIGSIVAGLLAALSALGGVIPAIGAAIGAIGGPITLVIAAIAAVAAGITALWNTNEDFRDAVISAWESVKSAAASIWGGISSFFTSTLPNALNTALQKVKDWGNGVRAFVAQTIPAVINSVAQWFAQLPGKIWEQLALAVERVKQWGAQTLESARTAASNTISAIVTTIQQLPGRIWTILQQAVQKMAEFGRSMADTGKQKMSEVVSAVVNTLQTIPGRVVSIGENIVKGVWSGISNMAGWIRSKISGWCNDIVSGFKRSLGIRSPSRLMRDEVGRYVGEGVAVGIEQSAGSVLDAMHSLRGIMVGAMDGVQIGTEFAGTASAANRVSVTVPQSDYSSLLAVMREILDAVRAGQTITIDGRRLTDTVTSGQRAKTIASGRAVIPV